MSVEKSILVGIVDRIIETAHQEDVTVDDIVHAFGRASFAPVLLIPAIAVVSPLSGIPLFSSFMGLLIFLISVQMLLRREQLWLPGWLLRRRTNSARVRTVFLKLRPMCVWLDAHTYSRLVAFVHRPLIFIPQTLCVISGLVMPFLEFVPFSASFVGAAVTLLAFGMLARDGLFVMLGVTLYLGPIWIAYHIV